MDGRRSNDSESQNTGKVIEAIREELVPKQLPHLVV
jgi:hypothetical protein